jgi:hypothetical protein
MCSFAFTEGRLDEEQRWPLVSLSSALHFLASLLKAGKTNPKALKTVHRLAGQPVRPIVSPSTVCSVTRLKVLTRQSFFSDLPTPVPAEGWV